MRSAAPQRFARAAAGLRGRCARAHRARAARRIRRRDYLRAGLAAAAAVRPSVPRSARAYPDLRSGRPCASGGWQRSPRAGRALKDRTRTLTAGGAGPGAQSRSAAMLQIARERQHLECLAHLLGHDQAPRLAGEPRALAASLPAAAAISSMPAARAGTPPAWQSRSTLSPAVERGLRHAREVDPGGDVLHAEVDVGVIVRALPEMAAQRAGGALRVVVVRGAAARSRTAAIAPASRASREACDPRHQHAGRPPRRSRPASGAPSSANRRAHSFESSRRRRRRLLLQATLRIEPRRRVPRPCPRAAQSAGTAARPATSFASITPRQAARRQLLSATGRARRSAVRQLRESAARWRAARSALTSRMA